MHGCTYIFVISDTLFIAIHTCSERCYFKAPFYLTSSYFWFFIFTFYTRYSSQHPSPSSILIFLPSSILAFRITPALFIPHVFQGSFTGVCSNFASYVIYPSLLKSSKIFRRRQRQQNEHSNQNELDSTQFISLEFDLNLLVYHQHFPWISLSIFPLLGYIAVNQGCPQAVLICTQAATCPLCYLETLMLAAAQAHSNCSSTSFHLEATGH